MSRELEHLSRRVASGAMSRRDFLGRAAALGVAAPFANSLLASAAAAATPVKGGTLTAGVQTGEFERQPRPGHLDEPDAAVLRPLLGRAARRADARRARPPRNSPNPGSPTRTPRKWTFKIRKDVTFHNGKTLTPDDVVATMERHSDKQSHSGALGIMQGIKSVKKDGDNVVFELKTGNADLPFLLEDYHLVIQPNGGKDKPDAGIGTGPYTVKNHQAGVRDVGEKYKNYWDGDKVGHADTVIILAINDPTARMSALQSGQVDLINRVEPKVVHLIKRLPGVTLHTVAGKGYYPFNMFCNTKPFDDNNVRMALKLAMDREEMLKTILRGYGSVGNDFPIDKAYNLFPTRHPAAQVRSRPGQALLQEVRP